MAAGNETVFESSDERWVVEAPLGEGGAGRTYLVRGERSGRRCVLKEIKTADVESWKALERFRREAGVLRALDHPAIPAYVDALAWEDEGRFAIVQEYVEGPTLQARLAAGEVPDAATVQRWLLGLLDVLTYLHGLVPPVVHRDISPKNIILGPRGPHLIDFGSVRVATGESGTVTTMGTFGYLPPEQAMGRPAPASDMYALGMTCVALASGLDPASLPLDPKTGRADVRAACGLPEPLPTVLERMTEPGLAARLSDPAHARAILDGTAPSKTSGAGPRGRRRLPVWLRALGVVAAMGLALASVAWGASLLQDHREVQTLGGWFTGHPSFFDTVVVSEAVFSPDGAQMVTASNHEVIVWDVASGDTVAELATEPLSSQDWAGGYLARFAPDGRLLVVRPEGATEYAAGTFSARDIPVSAHIFRGVGDATKARLRDAVWRRDRWIGAFEVWKERFFVMALDSGEVLLSLSLADDYGVEARFSADGRVLATTTSGKGQLRIWDMASAALRFDVRAPERSDNAFALSRDGRVVAAANRKGCALYDAATGARSRLIEHALASWPLGSALALSDDGALLALGHQSGIAIYATATGERVDDLAPLVRQLQRIVFDPEAKRLVATGDDDRIHVYALDVGGAP